MPRRALLAANTGGHLEQIVHLAPRLRPEFDDLAFATFDDNQSRSLLAGRETHLVENIPPRGLLPAARALPRAVRILRGGGFTDVVSTGAAIAVPFLLAARALGVRAHFVESAARADGPSLSGRLVRRIPGVHLYCQYPAWAGGRWAYRGSVMDRFTAVPDAEPDARPAGNTAARPVSRAVVTLGTMRGYPFQRAVDAAERVLAEIGTPDREVLWQVGDATVADPRATAHDMVPSKDLNAAIAQADVVIAHAGVGSSIRILQSGRAPVLLPRRREFSEHVDDHQAMIARDLARRGLAVTCAPEDLTAAHVETAMAVRVREEQAGPFELDTGRRDGAAA